MAAGVRAEEPLAELSHYVVARPIYNEAGFQEENERLPPPPPTLLERARAVCRWVGGGGRRPRSSAGPGAVGASGGAAGPPRSSAALPVSACTARLLFAPKRVGAATHTALPEGDGVWGTDRCLVLGETASSS